MPTRIHPTALIEAAVEIGDGTAIWDNVHVRGPSRIGAACIVGEKTYIAGNVSIGDRVKINAMVYICSLVTIEEGCMIAAGTIFTNDRFPRACTMDLAALRTSDVDEHTLPTLVRRGTTIGAGCVIGCNLTLGEFSMIGMGSVVTKTVLDFHLVVGNPARTAGAVCRCGEPIVRTDTGQLDDAPELACTQCDLGYRISQNVVTELHPDK